MDDRVRGFYEALQGITYLEWSKLRTTIDRSFEQEAAKMKSQLRIAAPDELEQTRKLLF